MLHNLGGWLTLNAQAVQAAASLTGILLSLVTIVVLIYTWRAASRQAEAATKLTEATERQIAMSAKQADAASQQVEVARRQITESLRPILTFRTPTSADRNWQTLHVINEGAGVALDVWWTYGKPSGSPQQRNRVGSGIIPYKSERGFVVQESRSVQEGILIVYESLAGVVSGTSIEWRTEGQARNYSQSYYPDLTEWARKILGSVLGEMEPY